MATVDPKPEKEPSKPTAEAPRIGSYRIIRPLGSGGMSTVYHGVHVESGHEVALKVLTRSLARNNSLLQRFLREAKSALALEHPNIVSIYDRGIDQGRHYLVLEYVAGGDLHDYVRRNGPLSVEEAVEAIRSVTNGLRYAAARGLIHRDIKPSNLLREPNGKVKIIDLGLALHYDNEDERVTREGTTVGTVDYMAPEQARDSRATSIQSDLYSLGCTFYYLLAGVPPFPGGDVTDKLTRHATAPAPNIRDLRPEVSEGLSWVIRRMMSKNPRDRFVSYDALLEALGRAMAGDDPSSPPVLDAIVLDDDDDDDVSLLRESSPAEDRRRSSPLAGASSKSSVLRRWDAQEASDDDDLPWPEPEIAPDPFQDLGDAEEGFEPAPLVGRGYTTATRAGSFGVGKIGKEYWVIGGVALAIAVLLFVIHGILQLQEGGAQAIARSGETSETAAVEPAAAPVIEPAPVVPSRGPGPISKRIPAKKTAPAQPVVQTWVEPVDLEPPAPDPRSAKDRELLPAWARVPIPERVPGPFVEVSRIAASMESNAVGSLHVALDRNIGGTVELIDEGPLPIDAFRVSGSLRLIRARKGRRSIIKIETPTIAGARESAAVCTLERKHLILDGIDVIVNVRELTTRQTALFALKSAELTLRDCTVTIINPGGQAFVFARADSTAAQPSRIRIERSLLRGGFGPSFELAGGHGQLSLFESAVIASGGPLVRLTNVEAGETRRLWFVDSFLFGPGPIVDLRAVEVKLNAALGITAHGSTFGRWQGAGVASVISAADAIQSPAKQIAWTGDENTYAGWMGYFACGKENAIRVGNLDELRSTWSARESESQEVLSRWPRPTDASASVLAELATYTPNAERIALQVARPREGLYEKTYGMFALPPIPIPLGWSQVAVSPPQDRFTSRRNKRGPMSAPNQAAGGFGPGFPRPGASPATAVDPGEIVFDANAKPWNGDLGRFLNEQFAKGPRGLRVRARGGGEFRSTPVRIPRGSTLTIRVDLPSGGLAPSWTPSPGASAKALIDASGSAVFLAGVVFKHADDENVEHLISVDEGHLALSRCRLLAHGSRVGRGADLIFFAAKTTQSIPGAFNPPLFQSPLDRPTCLILESTLITSGVALHCELGRGLIAISESAIFAGECGFDLVPAKVAKNRFVADLVLSRCTLVAEREIMRTRGWIGADPGPDRPWLVSSAGCAFLTPFERRQRKSVLLRAYDDSLGKGAFFWQANDDALEVDAFALPPEAMTAPNRLHDVAFWRSIWGKSRTTRLTGPNGSGAPASIRLLSRLQTGHVEPEDLVLDPDYHPGRKELTVGANLELQGVAARPTSRRRN